MDDQLKEWRERWDRGDTKFVPELFELAAQYEMDLKGILLLSSEVSDATKTALSKRNKLKGDGSDGRTY